MLQKLESFKRDSISRAVSGAAILNVSRIALAFVSGVVLARSLGRENLGGYAFILSTIALIGMPVKAGLPTLVVREVAKFQLNQSWGGLKGLMVFGNRFVLVCSLVFGSISAVIGILGLTGGKSELWFAFLISLALLPIGSLCAVRAAVLRGLRYAVAGQVPEIIVRPLVIIVILGGGLLLGRNTQVYEAILVTIFAATVALFIGIRQVQKTQPQEVTTASAEFTAKEWLASILPLSLFFGIKTAEAQVSIFSLGLLSPMDEVGVFRVAAQGAGLLGFGLNAVNLIVAPHIARLYEQRDMEQLQKLATKSTRLVLLFAVPAFLILVAIGRPLISFAFGSEFTGAYSIMVVLCIGQLVSSGMGSVALILNMTGHEKSTMKGLFAALVINACLAVALIPHYGAMGAAIASAVSLSVWNILLAISTWRILNINTTPLKLFASAH